MSTEECVTLPIATSPTLFVGQLLADRYEIQACIGEGGMGEVYRGRDRTAGRDVAVKVLKAELLASDAGALERFLREGEALRKLRHGNIVQLLDAFESDGRNCLIMELVEGGSLRRRLQREGPQPLQAALKLSLELADALACVHHMGILHRDIKPDNVLLAPDGTSRLTDFGVARIVAETQLTRAGSIVGTVDYLSPDALNGDPLDSGSDLWAFGVMLFEMLAGRRPFAGMSAGATVGAILGQPLPDLSELRPGLPPRLVSIVGRLLVKPRAQRLQSARQLAAELEVILADLPAQETPPQGPSSKDDPSLPPSTSVSSTGAIIGELVNSPTLPSTGVMDEVRQHSSAKAPPMQRPPGRASRKALFALPVVLVVVALVYGVRSRFAGVETPPRASDAASPAPAPGPSAEQPRRGALTELPMPSSSSPEALAAYRRGLQSLRLGGDAQTHFKSAAELDPLLAAAHLQYAALGSLNELTATVREHFRKARELSDTLSPRDRALLEGVEPVLTRQPADWAEAARRLGKALDRFPHDAQLWSFYGFFQSNGGQMEGSLRAHERASEEDPGFILPLAAKMEILSYEGRFKDAHAVAEACDRIVLGAAVCTQHIFKVALQQGECAEAERLARQMIAAGAALEFGYRFLALSLAAQRKPAATVRQALAQQLGQMAEPDRSRTQLEQRIAVAAWTGDFDAAARDARGLVQASESDRRQDAHGNPARWLVEILTETGRSVEAGQVAMGFLDRRDAWEPDPRAEDFAIAADWTPTLLAAAERADKLSHEEFLARRGAWMTEWEQRVAPPFRNYLWLQGYAAVAYTPEGAREALDALPKYSPIPPLRPWSLSSWGIGPAYLWTGQTDKAVQWLEDTTKSCYELQSPFEHTRAFLWLGRALEQKSDKARACAAYRQVLDRWGKAKPRSVTAGEARARSEALGCPGK